jgi:hypothetical protein
MKSFIPVFLLVLHDVPDHVPNDIPIDVPTDVFHYVLNYVPIDAPAKLGFPMQFARSSLRLPPIVFTSDNSIPNWFPSIIHIQGTPFSCNPC